MLKVFVNKLSNCFKQYSLDEINSALDEVINDPDFSLPCNNNKSEKLPFPPLEYLSNQENDEFDNQMTLMQDQDDPSYNIEIYSISSSFESDNDIPIKTQTKIDNYQQK